MVVKCRAWLVVCSGLLGSSRRLSLISCSEHLLGVYYLARRGLLLLQGGSHFRTDHHHQLGIAFLEFVGLAVLSLPDSDCSMLRDVNTLQQHLAYTGVLLIILFLLYSMFVHSSMGCIVIVIL